MATRKDTLIMNISEPMLEKKIIGIALMNPLVTEVVTVSPKYFINKNLAALYQAIADNPDANDIYRWVPLAKSKFGFHGDPEQVFKFKQTVTIPTTNWFNMYAQDLHRQYIRRQIAYYSREFSEKGDNDSYNQLAEYMHAYSHVELDNGHNNTQQVHDNILNEAKGPRPNGLDTGFTDINNALGRRGLRGGTLMTVGAGTNVGKTAFSVNMASNILRIATQHGSHVDLDYFTEEMSAEAVYKRFISNRTGVSDSKLVDYYSFAKKRIPDIKKADDELLKEGLHIYSSCTFEQIKAIIRRHAAQRKPNTYLAIIDHIGIVQFSNPTEGRKPRYLQIADICNGFRKLASQFNIPIIMQAQVNRGVANRDSNELKLSDLNESGAIEQDSDLVILLYRKHKKRARNVNMLIAKIAKNRLSYGGKIPFIFIGAELKFEELNRISPKETHRVQQLIYEEKEHEEQLEEKTHAKYSNN